MLILYLLLIAYIISINFYSFLLIKSLRDKEKQQEKEEALRALSSGQSTESTTPNKPPEKNLGKLFSAGLLGGAITIYVCMFLFKYKRSELLLMVFMPLLGVLNVYLWVILFKSGFSFFLIR